MNARIFLVLALLAVALSPAHAADSRKRDAAFTTQRALGEYDRTSGWCGGATGTPANIWDAAAVPAELETTAAGLENRRAIRWIYVYHADRTNSTTPMCIRLGPNTGTGPVRDALTCVGTSGSEATNGQMLPDRGAGRMILPAEIAAAASPTLFVMSSTGTVRYCVEVAWKS